MTGFTRLAFEIHGTIISIRLVKPVLGDTAARVLAYAVRATWPCRGFAVGPVGGVLLLRFGCCALRQAAESGSRQSRTAAINTNQPSRRRASFPWRLASSLYLPRPHSVLIQRSTQAGGGGAVMVVGASQPLGNPDAALLPCVDGLGALSASSAGLD